MHTRNLPLLKLFAVSLAVSLVLLGGSSGVLAQKPATTGQARAAQVGSTTLADTGTLSGLVDGRESSMIVAETSGVRGETLHATAVGTATDTRTEASMADVTVNSGANVIAVSFAMSEAAAECLLGAAQTSGFTSVNGLTINNVPVEVTGAANQTVGFAGGKVIINEQSTKSVAGGRASTLTVNAVHVIGNGVDAVIGASNAGVDCR